MDHGTKALQGIDGLAYTRQKGCTVAQLHSYTAAPESIVNIFISELFCIEAKFAVLIEEKTQRNNLIRFFSSMLSYTNILKIKFSNKIE